MSSRRSGRGIEVVPAGLVAVLVLGLVGSIFMGVRAKHGAVAATERQAAAITDSSLSLVFRPGDLGTVASQQRASALTQKLNTVVMGPSDIDGVTLWSPEGTILYSTDQGRIGNRLDGERDRIREALRGTPQSGVADGRISVMLPFELASGVGAPAVVELTRSDAPVAAAAGPWRTTALFIAVALVVVVGLLVWARMAPAPTTHPVLRRAQAYGTGNAQGQGARSPQPGTAAAPGHAEHGGQARGPTGAQAPPPRSLSVPAPGMKEEADARRMAEERARAAEERLTVLQEQYRKTLEELQVLHRQAQAAEARPDPALEDRARVAESRARQLEEHARDADGRARDLEERARELEERAGLFERQAAASQAEMEELSRQLTERVRTEQEGGQGDDARARQVQQEAMGLRAELEGLQTQLAMARRELEDAKPRAARARDLEGDLEAATGETRRAQEEAHNARAELTARSNELDGLRREVRTLRAEEQRAAMLDDELRAAKAELRSLGASHRADLIEREAELEEKVRTMREGFQAELSRLETEHREELERRERELSARVAGAEDAAAQRMDAAERELAERAKRFERAEDEIASITADAHRLAGELTIAQAELETTVAQLQAETERARAAEERLMGAEGSSTEAATQARRTADELEAATQENAELNRRLQELEARRALEIADAEGRADLDEILRVTQERLAGQTEKLIAAEERAQALERQVGTAGERLEEVEGELRQRQMAEAMREIRGEDRETAGTAPVDAPAEAGAGVPMEDRRASTPFMNELSLDAKKSLARIMGITQVLKHKKDAKEQTQLVRQLTAHTRRLDRTVADLADADRLARGEVELTVRRTDLEPLIQRVVEESGLEADHEMRVAAERLVVAVDPQRTEQIVSSMLRVCGDRTPAKKPITVRLLSEDGGAVIVVEDPEPSSDASMSPVVQRLAEVQGGWAKVEDQGSGGSAFSVFLPDGAGVAGQRSGARVVVDEPEVTWEPHDEKALVEELHRLSTAED